MRRCLATSWSNSEQAVRRFDTYLSGKLESSQSPDTFNYEWEAFSPAPNGVIAELRLEGLIVDDDDEEDFRRDAVKYWRSTDKEFEEDTEQSLMAALWLAELDRHFLLAYPDLIEAHGIIGSSKAVDLSDSDVGTYTRHWQLYVRAVCAYEGDFTALSIETQRKRVEGIDQERAGPHGLGIILSEYGDGTLFAAVRRYLKKNARDPDALLQELQMKVYRRPVESIRDTKAYVFKAARRLLCDESRYYGRRIKTTALSYDIIDTKWNGPALIDFEDELKRFPSDCRSALRQLLAGRNKNEIAEELGVSPGKLNKMLEFSGEKLRTRESE